MKLAVFLGAVSAVASQGARDQNNSNGRRAAVTSEAEYWNSYIHTTGSFPSAPSSPRPSPAPTPGIPGIPATPAPTPGTAPPTAICEIDIVVDCAYINPETGYLFPCEEIPPIDTKECMCPECARALAFIYTGEMCSGNEVACTDSPGPSGEAIVSFFACDSTTPAFTTALISPGTPIDLSLGGDVCLPDCMDITVSNAAGQLLQAFQFDKECDVGNELILKESYGALEFNGYTCDENDVNNCLLDVIFGVSACNLGTANMTLYEFAFNFNGTMTDFLVDGSRPIVAFGNCHDEVGEAFVDRCLENAYVATATANATNPLGGPLCDDSAEVTILIPPPSPPPYGTPPTPPPYPLPTPSPSQSSSTPSVLMSSTPSSRPSKIPSSQPSSKPSTLMTTTPSQSSSTPSVFKSATPSPTSKSSPLATATPSQSIIRTSNPTVGASATPSSQPTKIATSTPSALATVGVCESLAETLPQPAGFINKTGTPIVGSGSNFPAFHSFCQTQRNNFVMYNVPAGEFLYIDFPPGAISPPDFELSIIPNSGVACDDVVCSSVTILPSSSNLTLNNLDWQDSICFPRVPIPQDSLVTFTSDANSMEYRIHMGGAPCFDGTKFMYTRLPRPMDTCTPENPCIIPWSHQPVNPWLEIDWTDCGTVGGVRRGLGEMHRGNGKNRRKLQGLEAALYQSMLLVCEGCPAGTVDIKIPDVIAAPIDLAATWYTFGGNIDQARCPTDLIYIDGQDLLFECEPACNCACTSGDVTGGNILFQVYTDIFIPPGTPVVVTYVPF